MSDYEKRLAKKVAEEKTAAESIAKKLNGTINDVLLSSATGALRTYLNSDGTAIETPIHVAVPFNLRPLDKPTTR